jgi:hypothetical protein
VCVACSQFQKLEARLLAIGLKTGTLEKDWAAGCFRTEENGKIYICQEMFTSMQEQLKECVHHHRLILK